jgi:hypothetical protein
MSKVDTKPFMLQVIQHKIFLHMMNILVILRILSSLQHIADCCVEALEEALKKGRPEVFNTDQGSQFTGNNKQLFFTKNSLHLFLKFL